MRMKKEVKDSRVKKWNKERNEKLRGDIDNLHVVLQRGNRKTGISVWTVSLLPIIDCCNCSGCMFECYDAVHDMIYPQVVNDRIRNSIIHMKDPYRYWHEIDMQVKANFVTELRLNVGGDLSDGDFEYVMELGKANPRTAILFFTKNYSGINKFLDDNEFPDNVRPILSAWEGMAMDNRHNLPMAHVLYKDGRTTAPEYGAYYCGGNCSECALEEKGCWTLQKGEHVIFKVH